MMLYKPRNEIRPTGIARPWAEDEVIVSKTNAKGHITYANEVFLRVAQLTESEALGAPHNIIRHPQMPRCLFKLVWDALEAKKEIFAYINNLAKSGDHYWVFAHVTPSFDAGGEVVGYHSNRRKPKPAQVEVISRVYDLLLDEEQKHGSRKDALAASTALFMKKLQEEGTSYDEFIFSF